MEGPTQKRLDYLIRVFGEDVLNLRYCRGYDFLSLHAYLSLFMTNYEMFHAYQAIRKDNEDIR